MSSAPVALKFITLPARTTHTATIIFSHGLGDTGEGWRPVAHMLGSQLPHVKWILPHAVEMPVTVNGGMLMPAWFDIFSLGKSDDREDEEGILRSSAAINQLIKVENDAGIPNERSTSCGLIPSRSRALPGHRSHSGEKVCWRRHSLWLAPHARQAYEDVLIGCYDHARLLGSWNGRSRCALSIWRG
ncbi:carbohydrate esterase family 1 protein [Ceratobasidium sp. AG-Ba]|nr:carbohydrate esterase family 1 protein [Ceratobasidium sp. AG-Ba]